MGNIFSDRIADVPKSFIREILKTTVQPDIISFAGGLPNRNFFPAQEIKDSCIRVLDTAAGDALQYSTTEGYLPLREFIAERYRKKGLPVQPDEILITNGSQQGLDLISKIILNEGDQVLIERPGYLGAIQSFSVYRAKFLTAELDADGPSTEETEKAVQKGAKLFYAVPNFQNPSGISWSDERRKEIAGILTPSSCLFIEDDPYGELRFAGAEKSSVKRYLPDATVLLGSFSKIFAPSFRLGWIVAPTHIMDKLITAKQAADLHTNYFSQRVLQDYLENNDIDRHIATIRAAYGSQRGAMIEALKRYMPKEVTWTEPEGGMFLWLTLPDGMDSLKIFDPAIKAKVAFVPGHPFYPENPDVRTMRLNFSCVDEKTIEEGIKRLSAIIAK